MIDKVVTAAVESLLKNNLLKQTEIELYRFGINRLLLFCINITTTIIIGIICGMVWQSILFSVAYIPLRRYAGGYHAKTQQECYVLSTLLVFSVLKSIRWFLENNLIILLIVLSSSVIIFIKAPIESNNKPLNKKERNAFRKKTRVLLTIQLMLLFLFLVVNIEVAICISLSIVSSAFMLVIPEKITN